MSDELLAWSLELLSPLGAVRSKRMFGGHGLYVDELFVAIVIDQQLYLKVDEPTRDAFTQAGCAPFTYTFANGRQGSMSYYTVPAEAMESPTLMQPWARLALASALRAQASKAAAAQRKPKAAPRKAKVVEAPTKARKTVIR